MVVKLICCKLLASALGSGLEYKAMNKIIHVNIDNSKIESVSKLAIKKTK
jgi:hypothetical protein